MYLWYLLAAASAPDASAACRIPACFSPPRAHGPPGRRPAHAGSLALDAAQGDSRRSVLRGGAFGVSTLVSANSRPAAAVAAAPPPRDVRRTLNFPQTRPGLWIGEASAGRTCEVFVDLACPYSRKIFDVLSKVSGAYSDRLAFAFHNVIQPWHHQSLWLHESTFAVKVLYPAVELTYWTALFEQAPRWYDKEIYGMTRGEFYEDIAAFTAGVVVTAGGADGRGEGEVKARILQYLIPPKQPGGRFPEEAAKILGSGPEDDENALFPLTKQIVKFSRKRGVHVTPTVFFNGIEQAQISSEWNEKKWRAFLDQALC